MLICALGTLALWPQTDERFQVVHESVNEAYNSVCQISSSTEVGEITASGVLLESGYILTAAHVIDLNRNGILDPGEGTATVTFPNAGHFTARVTTILCSNMKDLDVALLRPEVRIPLPGVKLLSDKEYRNMKIGTPISITL